MFYTKPRAILAGLFYVHFFTQCFSVALYIYTSNLHSSDPLKKIIAGIIKGKWLVLAAVLLLTAFFGFQLKNLQVNSNIVDALPKTDSIVQQFKAVGNRFGSNQIGLIIIEADNVFEAQTLNHIQQISDSLSLIDGVISVTSITNMRNFKAEADNFEVDDLISRARWPQTRADADSLRDVITQNNMVTGSLVAADGSSAIVLFYFQNDADAEAVAKNVTNMVNGLHLPEKVYYAGTTFLTTYISEIIKTDMLKLIPISFLLIALVLYLSFKTARGVILPLLTAGLAILWSIGTFVLLGFKLSMVSNNVPIIILAVGSAYSIHVINSLSQSVETENKQAILRSMTSIALPVILAALNTVFGFLSFIFGSYLSMIRDFGILAAMGTFYSLLLAMVFIPAMQVVFPPKQIRQKATSTSAKKDSFMAKWLLTPLHKTIYKHPKRILFVWLILVVAGVGGMMLVKRSVSVADYFKRSHPANVADRIMEANYGGSKPVFAVFKGDVQSPEVLQAMADFQNYLQKSPYITGTQSIADVVIKLNRALGGETDIPAEKESVQQLWFILGQQNLSQLITEDLDEAIIIAKFNNAGQANIGAFDAYVKAYLRSHKSDDFVIEVSGMPYVNAQLDRSLLQSQITSLIIALILVIGLVSFIFKSAKEGFYASVPILATIAVLYGVMGFTGIPLNVVTVLVASVAMGIGIDYSIHFIAHFNLALKHGDDVEHAIKHTVLGSGKAILINFISVSAGFLVLAFSDFMPMVYFGILIALSMLGASMGALTLLPAMLVLSKKNKKHAL